MSMNLTHICGNTWVIEGSGLMGLYRLDENKCILLDSGEAFERDTLAGLLSDHGLTPVGVISSHFHIDHSINNRWLKESYGTLIAAPAGEVCVACSPNTMKVYFYSASPDTLARTFDGMVCPVDCPIPGEDGRFSFCGADFSILHTPGHSIDHIAIITPDNVCYAGDSVVSNEALRAKLPYHMFLKQAMDSAVRLKSLDCPFFLVSHRGIHDDIAPVVDANLELFRRRAEEILSLITRPMTFNELWQAVNETFCLLSTRPLRAALMERNLRSFVDYLMDTGRLTWLAERGMLYYAPIGGPNET